MVRLKTLKHSDCCVHLNYCCCGMVPCGIVPLEKTAMCINRKIKREINISESIKKKRLITKQSLLYHLLPLCLSGGALLFMASMPLLDMLAEGRYGHAQIFLIIQLGLLVFLSWAIKNSVNSFAFQVLRGKNADENRRIAQKVLQRYKKLSITHSDNQFIRASQGSGPFEWRKELYLIFDKDDILINFSSLARFDIPDPFCFYSDRKSEREFLRKLYSESGLGVPPMPEPNF